MEKKDKHLGIVVFCELRGGLIIDNSLELVSQAKSQLLNSCCHEVIAVILGSDLREDQKEAVFDCGADEVVLLRNEQLEHYRPDLFASTFSDYLIKRAPRFVFIGATAIGEELAPTIGAILHTGVAAHCLDLSINDEDNLVQIVPAFGGKVVGEIFTLHTLPQIASAKEGLFKKQLNVFPSARKFSIINVEVEKYDQGIILLVNDPILASKTNIQKSDVIIGGGFGVGSIDEWQILEELARLLGGATGCTRPALDEGWAESENTMIGTSGVVVKPKLYLCIGISGAAHHLCGIRDAQTIVSINNDPQAPIIASSDYAIIEDWHKIVPLLNDTLRGYNSPYKNYGD